MTPVRLNSAARQGGFTLVELAIVLVIIGLLLGGVLKGQELIENARVTSVINQVTSFRAAVSGFQDKYGALPGDYTFATTRIANCTGCVVGDGSGTIGAVIATPGVADIVVGTENTQAWLHLLFGNFIQGISGALVEVFGEAYPAARTGGGFKIAFTTPVVNAGHYFRLQLSPTLAAGAAANLGALTPSQAAQIDRRLDDGTPTTGTVQQSGAASCVLAGPPVTYAELVTSKDCNLFFAF